MYISSESPGIEVFPKLRTPYSLYNPSSEPLYILCRVKSPPMLYHSMITQSGELNVTLQGGAVYTVVVTQASESSSINVTVSYRKTGWTLVRV